MATSKKKKPVKKSSKPAKKAVSKPISAKAVKSVKWDSIINPLNDRLVVTVNPAEERTSGGIIIPGSATQQPNRGKVLAVGPGGRTKKGTLRPLDVSVGDEVIFADHSGTKLNVNDQEFLILREDEVLGILTN